MKKLSLICIALFVMNYINAQKAELVKTYHTNGKLASIGKQYPAIVVYEGLPPIGREKTGEWKWYHENGQLKTIGFYTEEKKSDGEINTFEDKEWKTYYQTGNLKSIGSYKRGRKDGVWKEYHNEDGKIHSIGSFKNNRKDGKWKYYDKKGKVYLAGNYENDKQSGTWTKYYNTGELEEVSDYENGNITGEAKVYHKNGKPWVFKTYADGIRVGEAKWFHENGKLATVGNYSNDLQVGEWKRYDENGGVSNTEMFYNINKGASLKNVELRAVSAFKNNSKKETRVDVKFKSSNIGATIYPPGSRSAFFLKDEKGNRYKLIGQENWPGDGANGFGRSGKSIKDLTISLIFEHVPLDEVKKLDLMEGDASGSKGWHFHDILSQNKTITYASDECISGDCKNGKGVFKWSNGDKYEGEFNRGRKHGKGIFYAANGDKFEGEFSYNKYYKGTLTFSNGEKFMGDYNSAGKIKSGTFSYKNGDTYDGYYSGGIPSRSGTYTFANGSKYIGQFKEGKYEGYGIYTGNDEDKYIGLWKAGLKHGNGVHFLSTGDIYVGNYENDRQKGGKTYTTAAEKNKIVDKYNFGTVDMNYSNKEKKEKKKELFKRVVEKMKNGTDLLFSKKYNVESVDYTDYKIVFSTITSGSMLGIDMNKKHYYFLDFNNVTWLFIEAWESGEIKTSLYFNPDLKKRSDNLKTGEKGKLTDEWSGFELYFTNDILSVIEYASAIENIKKL